MKLTRRLLRKLIIEAIIDEADTKRYISSPDGDVTPADLAVLTAQGKDILAADVHPSIATLVQSDDIESRAQGRVLADTLEDIPEITPGEATAIDILGQKKSFEEDRGLEYSIDKKALYGAMKSKSKSLLTTYFGFQYIEDLTWLFSGSGQEDYQDVHDMLRFQAQALGCDIDDLAFVDSETSERRQTREAIYDMLRALYPSQKPPQIPIPGDDGYHGHNELYDLDGLRVLFTNHMGGYYTTTICGKRKKDKKDSTEDLVMESRCLIIEALTESSHDLSNAQKLKRLMQLEPDMSSRDSESFVMATNLADTLVDDDPEILDMVKGVASDYGKRFNPADLAKMKSILAEFEAIDASPPPDIVVFHKDDIVYGTVTADGYDYRDIYEHGDEAGLSEIIDGTPIQGSVKDGNVYIDEDWLYFDRDPNLSLEDDVQNRLDAAREVSNEMQDVEEETFFFLNNYFEAQDVYPEEIYRRYEDIVDLMYRYREQSRKMFGRVP